MRDICIIGLTGQTGAGKSSVSSAFRSQGLTVIDCDEISHLVTAEGKRCLADLALEFGIGILNADGTLNRKRLGAIVFNDKEKLESLNRIIFPHIIEYLDEEIDELEKKGTQAVVLDAPTLFESGMDERCDSIISVIAPLQERLNRIVVRDHLTDEEARARINSQHDDDYYISRSQQVIINDGDEKELRIKTLELINLLNRAVSARKEQLEKEKNKE